MNKPEPTSRQERRLSQSLKNKQGPSELPSLTSIPELSELPSPMSRQEPIYKRELSELQNPTRK